jgi:TPR repeat protein
MDQEKQVDVQNPVRPIATAAIIAPQPELTVLPPPLTPASPPAADQSPPAKVSRPLDPEVVALLIKEAEKYISTGDVVTARMIFRRAAEAGDATAALALAATYDPTMLAKLGVMGMGASDLEKARAWYRMAESFGSVEAKQRLRSLDRQ